MNVRLETNSSQLHSGRMFVAVDCRPETMSPIFFNTPTSLVPFPIEENTFMEAKRISVVMAVYNGSKFLTAQLQSLVDQNRLPDELIICDDGSTDASYDILSEFTKNAPITTRLFQNDRNLGFSKNFEKCLGFASGDLVFFCDQDDVWLPTKIDVLVQRFNERPDLMLVIHDGQLVDHDLTWHGAYKLSQVEALYSQDKFVSGSLSAARKDLIRLALPIPEGICHDSWLHALAEALNARDIFRHRLQLIRRHGDNASMGCSSAIEPVAWFKKLAIKLSVRDDAYWDSFALLDEEVVHRIRSRYSALAFPLGSEPESRLSTMRSRAMKMRKWKQLPGYKYLCKLLLN